MAYTPQNLLFFTNAFSGALAGMIASRGIVDPDPAGYDSLVSVAGAFAQEIDTIWGVRPTNGLDLESVEEACHAVWIDRAPHADFSTLTASTYQVLARAVIALVTSGDDYYTDQGITPPPVSESASEVLIWRPGVASADNHVETWAEVDAAIATALGLITIIVDDSVAPAVVPATANTECFGLTVFTTLAVVPGALLRCADGAQIKNVGTIENGLIFIGAPSAVIPLVFTKPALVLREGGVIQSDVGALVAMIDVQVSTLTLFTAESSVLDNSNSPAVPLINIGAGNTLFWILLEATFPFLTTTLIQGDASTFYTLVHDASQSSVPQALFLGTFSETRTSLVAAALPSAGITADRPVTTFTGQTYFDTSLNIPIWWDGALWVDATGAPV